jgi:hypothetical protein
MRQRKSTWLAGGVMDNKHGIEQPCDLLSTTQQQQYNMVTRTHRQEINRARHVNGRVIKAPKVYKASPEALRCADKAAIIA